MVKNPLLRNKKGIEVSLPMLISWFIITAIFISTTIFFVTGFIKKDSDVRWSEMVTIENRMLYSPSGISFTDYELGRTFTGKVELNNLENSFLDSAAYFKDNQMISMKISALDMNGRERKSAIYNELWYNRWLPLVGQSGSGGASQHVDERYAVFYLDGDYAFNGRLRIQMVVPNG